MASVNEPTPLPGPVRARIRRAFWWPTLFLIGMSVAVPLSLTTTARAASEPWAGAFFALLSLPLLCVGLYMAVALVRTEIRADATGLWWRELGEPRQVTWDQVRDFYEDQKPKGECRCVVLTDSARLTFGRELSHYGDLRAAVRSYASQSQTRDWVHGVRADWPRTFHYRTGDNRTTPWTLIGFCILGLAFSLWDMPGRVGRLAGEIGWGMALCALAFYVLVLIVPMLAGLWAVFVWWLPEARRRRYETVTINSEGFRFAGAHKVFSGRWSEVVEVRCVPLGRSPARTVVRTLEGEWDFSGYISEVWMLREILNAYVPTPIRRLGSATEEDLGGEAARWSGGHPGVGRRVYHYRNRGARAMVWVAWAPALGGAAAFLLTSLSALPGSEGLRFLHLTQIGLILALWASSRYFQGGIELDDRQITQRTLWGSRSVLWEDVESYSEPAADLFSVYRVSGPRARIHFWGLISDLHELKQEIAKRSRNTKERGWEAEVPHRGGLPEIAS